MNISVVGTGYVGLVTGACLASKGHHVICVDNDPAKVERIGRGEAPFHENGLEPLLRDVINRNLEVTSDLAGAVAGTELTFIAVGTPFDGGGIDLRFIREVAADIGKALRNKPSHHCVVIKSTVVPGTTDQVVTPLLEEASGKRAGVDFSVGMNPEFLTEGTAIRDFMHPDRIVLGGMDERTRDCLAEVYPGFETTEKIRTNNATAEMIKYASNSLLATMISFSNEIANLCAQLGGIDVVDVMDGVHASHYLRFSDADGNTTRAPISSFLEAGCGFGGSCLPKDVKALIAHGTAAGIDMPLLRAVIDTNARQPARTVELLRSHFESLTGVKVTVLGLAFKPDTDDVRESPAFPIINALSDEGARVSAYDPIATEAARPALAGLDIHYHDNLDAALQDADAVVLVTRWDEFERVPEIIRAMTHPPVLVDGRRMLPRDSVPRYEGIGLKELS